MAKQNKFDIADYCQGMEAKLGGQEGEARLFWKAFSFAVDAHQDQKRKSGEAYISHPLEVVWILVEEMEVNDPETLAAAVLHDTVEDVPEVTQQVISELFGKNVEAIVEGCTKISHFSGNRQTFYNLVHRKIFSRAASRIEIMLIKLADRLHNLRTLHSMPQHKRQKIAEETLNVYAPIAQVLGLYDLKREFYNLALRYKFPRQSSKVFTNIHKLKADPEVLAIQKKLQEEMRLAWVTCEIQINPKGLWAYYDHNRKLLKKKINTPVEIIVITSDIQSCYRALGIINQHYPPTPRTIRDFIANAKLSGYQSLHVRANIKGRHYLFKIKTGNMHAHARTGVINEWSKHRQVPIGFEKEVREMLNILGTDQGISYRKMIAVSGKKEIYIYTPDGDSIGLPKQSLVLDFAFKVHTDLGKHCVSAIINGKQVGFDHILQDGEQVEIVSQDKPICFEPSIQELCQTPKARTELGRIFTLRREGLARKIGDSIIHQELKRYGLPVEVLLKEQMTYIMEYFNLKDRDELFRDIGQGKLRLKELIHEIKQGIYAGRQTLPPPTGALNRIELNSMDPACIKFSQCCNPTPTEKWVFGLLSERGLSVHRKNCSKIKSLKVQREDVVELRWQLKTTMITKPQILLILQGTTRNRLFMMLGVAPVEMKILDVVLLSKLPSKTSPWEIKFEVNTLYGLKNILNHFTNAGILYEFGID